MIYNMNGNILNCEQKYIIHQVNCQGNMGAGLAKQLANKYPEIIKPYKDTCLKNLQSKLLGEVLKTKTKDGKIILNIFGQGYYGAGSKQTNYNALINGLTKIFLNANGDVAIPYKIGCGLAGGNWTKVYKIIEILAEDFKYNIYIYKI